MRLQELLLITLKSGEERRGLGNRKIWMLLSLTEKEDYVLLPPPAFHMHPRWGVGISERDAASEGPWKWGKDREEIFMDQCRKAQDSKDGSAAEEWAVIRGPGGLAPSPYKPPRM